VIDQLAEAAFHKQFEFYLRMDPTTARVVRLWDAHQKEFDDRIRSRQRLWDALAILMHDYLRLKNPDLVKIK